MPQSLIIIGGGYIGLELAFLLTSWGVEVDLVHSKAKPLDGFDQLVQDLAIDYMNAHDINFIANTKLDAFEELDGQLACYEEGKLIAEAEKVLVCIGRQPNTSDLGLESIGVEVAILVNDVHRTTVDHIYAIGDAIDKQPLTPVASRAGQRVGASLGDTSQQTRMDDQLVSSMVFIHPALATVGLSEDQAINHYGRENIEIMTQGFTSMYHRVTGQDLKTSYKLIFKLDDRRLIGVHGSGEPLAEAIQIFALAMKAGVTLDHFHQTLGDSSIKFRRSP